MSLDRLLAELIPECADLCRRHLAACHNVGIELAVTAGFRTPAEQMALYTKGRLYNATAEGWTVVDPKRVVTNALPVYAPHCRGAAYDVVPIVEEKARWDRIDLFTRVGEIGEELGLTWGGRWPKLKDMPHFELPGWKLLPFKEG